MHLVKAGPVPVLSWPCWRLHWLPVLPVLVMPVVLALRLVKD